MEYHFRNIRDVFERLRRSGLKPNLKQCEFFGKEVNYVGQCARFVFDLVSITTPLYELTSTGTKRY